jgi:hypothetical protein
LQAGFVSLPPLVFACCWLLVAGGITLWECSRFSDRNRDMGAYKVLIPLKYKGFQGCNCEKITIKGQNRNKIVTFWFIIESGTAKRWRMESKGKSRKSIEVLL